MHHMLRLDHKHQKDVDCQDLLGMHTTCLSRVPPSVQAVCEGVPGIKLAYGVDDIFSVLGQPEVPVVHD
jgi:hypothetical protein